MFHWNGSHKWFTIRYDQWIPWSCSYHTLHWKAGPSDKQWQRYVGFHVSKWDTFLVLGQWYYCKAVGGKGNPYSKHRLVLSRSNYYPLKVWSILMYSTWQFLLDLSLILRYQVGACGSQFGFSVMVITRLALVRGRECCRAHAYPHQFV